MSIKAPTPSDLVRDCLTLLALRKVLAWRNNSGAVRVEGRYVSFGAVGSSDIIGVLPGGRFMACECKTGTGRLTQAQASWLALVRAQGAAALVVRSIQELDHELMELLRETP